MDNWSSYSILLRVCRDLDFKDELLIQNLLIDLQKLAERETESERPNIDLHNINISLGCLADLHIWWFVKCCTYSVTTKIPNN